MNKQTPKSLEAMKLFRSVAKDKVVEQKKQENKTKKNRRSITYLMYLICLFFSYVPQRLGWMILCVF